MSAGDEVYILSHKYISACNIRCSVYTYHQKYLGFRLGIKALWLGRQGGRALRLGRQGCRVLRLGRQGCPEPQPEFLVLSVGEGGGYKNFQNWKNISKRIIPDINFKETSHGYRDGFSSLLSLFYPWNTESGCYLLGYDEIRLFFYLIVQKLPSPWK